MKTALLGLNKRLDLLPKDEKLVLHSKHSLNLLLRLEDQPMSISAIQKYIEENKSGFLGYTPDQMLVIYHTAGVAREEGNDLELTDDGVIFLDTIVLKDEELKQKYQ